MNNHHSPDDATGAVKTVSDLVPAVVQALLDGSAARREKRLRALRSLHQRTRAAEKQREGGSR